LRDDIFISKDRTKFFDYIIPIVPVMDSSNSYEQFLKHLKGGSLFYKFDLSFLQSLSLYVDDMRILKNIYNEFVVYFNRLNTTDLDCNKMMAMIAYKNLFPRDFSDLQLAKGFIHELFAQKQRLIEETLSSTENRKKELCERIESIKKEALITQQELDDAYTAKNASLKKDYYGNFTPESQKLKIQYDSELTKRKQAVQDIVDDNRLKLEAELSDINQDMALTRIKLLKELITRDNIDSAFTVTHINEIGEVDEFKEIKSSNYFTLLKFLIRNGFIDETYSDYMTYFYDDSISANDKTFLRRITDKRGAEYTYALREPKKVLESPILREVEFEQEETLNFDLLECLLLNDNHPKYVLYLKTLIFQVRKGKNFDFISKYYDTGKALKQFVERFNQQWPTLFSTALEQQLLPTNQLRQLSIETLYYSDDESIRAVNANGCLTKYISSASDYLAIGQPDVEKLAEGFSLIGVSFVGIDYDTADKTLFDEVYRRCLYELNFENISLMLRTEYQIKTGYDITHRNYTLVQSQTDAPLAAYISDNMTAYIDIMLDNCEDSIADDEDIVISLLNNADVDSVAKERYINLLTTPITDITEVTDSAMWTAMLNSGIVTFSVSNFVNYFIKHEIDITLIDFINKEKAETDFSTTEGNFGEDIARQLFYAVAICNEIDTAKYKEILNDLNYYFDNYESDGIADDKFEVLINEQILKMDADSLAFVREKYARYILSFIRRNLDDYLALQTIKIFRLNEVLKILTWNIDDDKKIKLLALTSANISIVGKNYSDSVNSYIIANNLEVDDNPSLYKSYSQYGQQTQAAITSLAILNTNEIITENLSIDDALLSLLLRTDEITRDKKLKLFTMAIPNLTEEACKTHFDELELSDLKNIFEKNSGRRNYEKSGDVTTVLYQVAINRQLKYNNPIPIREGLLCGHRKRYQKIGL
jgi:hypothetical protein